MEYTFKKQQSKNYTFLNLPKTNCIVKIYKLMDLCTNLTWMSVVQGLVQDFVVVSQLVSSFSRCTSASPLSNTFACTFSPFHPGQPLWHLFLFLCFCFFANILSSLQGQYLAVTCIVVAFLLLKTSSETEIIQFPEPVMFTMNIPFTVK